MSRKDQMIFQVKYNGIIKRIVSFQSSFTEFRWDNLNLTLSTKRNPIMNCKMDAGSHNVSLFKKNDFIGVVKESKSLFNSKFIAELKNFKIYIYKQNEKLRFYLGKKVDNINKIAEYAVTGWFQPKRQLVVADELDPALIILLFNSVEYLISKKYEVL
eukprot:NODE_398_length_8105_cov_1.375094.p10 type:complete len:158 gc:universal NODE_398_length_8105_cov_1.375094:6297-6770(+)